MKFYQIIMHQGLGVMECPTISSAIEGELFDNEQKAEQRADELWKKHTTEDERKSSWCPLHYSVKEVIVK